MTIHQMIIKIFIDQQLESLFIKNYYYINLNE